MVTTRSSGASPGNLNGDIRKVNGHSTSPSNTRKRTKRDTEETTESNVATKRPKLLEKTDPLRWRLLNDEGRLSWHYLEDDKKAKKWPQSYADKWYLGLPLGLPDLPKPTTALDAAKNGLEFYEKLQLEPGNWGCEYGGPMFLLPGVVIAWYVTKTHIPIEVATEIKNYLFARAHPEDGGWGLHIEADSSVFGTSMNYTALRLIGVEADDPRMVKARATLLKLGGLTHAPHWSKWWHSVLGICKWDIVNPVPPELWILPDWVPFHPWRWWIHIRQVFCSMSYVYSKRWVCEETEVIRELRHELFVEPYGEINWAKNRNTIAPLDNFYPKTWILNTLNWLIVNIWNPYLRTNSIKERAEAWVSDLVTMEDENTDFLDLAPVNAPMNTVVCYIRDGPGSYSVRRHLERLNECSWVNAEGMLMNGTNGVQCWDTAFSIQAAVDGGLEVEERWRPMLLKALQFLDDHQIRENAPHHEKSYRHPRKGAWAFSNKDQGYAVSDCVSEALKSVIMLQKTPGYPQLLDDQRIYDAVDTLLTYQNKTGACSSYEVNRAGEWLEVLNAAEVFGNIMVEYEYPECTTAAVTALSLFHKYWPEYRAAEVTWFIKKAISWIESVQRPDGSWYGSWGICFTYGGMFALESLASAGKTYSNSTHSKKGCDFFISHQREDGGWSESYKACEDMVYTEHPSGSLVVQTAWALVGLMKADYPDIKPIKKGIRFLMKRQQPNGEWLQEAIEGVFNKSCMISYPNYKFIFPLKALGMFAKKYPDEKVL